MKVKVNQYEQMYLKCFVLAFCETYDEEIMQTNDLIRYPLCNFYFIQFQITCPITAQQSLRVQSKWVITFIPKNNTRLRYQCNHNDPMYTNFNVTKTGGKIILVGHCHVTWPCPEGGWANKKHRSETTCG